jgi:predicted NBD/HSP70 family sugar kinase
MMHGHRRRHHRLRPRDRHGARHAGHLRGLNLERVLAVAVDRPGTFTRAELIEATGLSAPTVGSVVSHMIRDGLITDMGTAPSRGGRRPSLMEFNARHGFVAGIDLGPTRTRLAVADLRGHSLAHRIITTPTDLDPPTLLSSVAVSLHALMKEFEVPCDRLLAVAAGAPGAVDLDSGVVTIAPNLPGWKNIPMRDLLQQTLTAPVVVENDVNLALLGEHWQGAARGHDTCAFVYVGTGIGAAVLIDGALHHGHHYMAGEIAVMCMGPQFLEVDFGSRGCLETVAGLKAVAARWPGAAESDPEQWASELFAAANAGDEQARQAIDETARLLGIAVANLGAVVDPSLIILGGALFANAEPLVDAVRKVVMRITRAPLEIVSSSLGKEAPLAGCILLATTDAREHLRQTLRGWPT